jgi:hypothetical protein
MNILTYTIPICRRQGPLLKNPSLRRVSAMREPKKRSRVSGSGGRVHGRGASAEGGSALRDRDSGLMGQHAGPGSLMGPGGKPAPACSTPPEPLRGRGSYAQYRVWIARVSGWQPREFADVPPMAVALEPAEEGLMSARQAARYVQVFNRIVLRTGPKVWAIALPVAIRYQGDPVPGQRLIPSPVRGPRARRGGVSVRG